MNDIIALAITGSVCGGIGIAIGMWLQRRRNKPYIEALEERTAAAEIGHLQTAVAIAWDFLNDDDDDWGDMDTFDMDEHLMRQSGSVS